jgi:hypothetical protein
MSFFLPGYNWTTLTDFAQARTTNGGCDQSLCENGGVCLPGEGVVRPSGSGPQPPPGTVACLCRPGFTGPDCGTAISSCAENPCQHEASCTEDPSGGTGYTCNCDGTGHRGRHCELEANSCGPDACRNGGSCLAQHAGFLCECSPQYGGMRCDNVRTVRIAAATAGAGACCWSSQKV